MIRKVVRCLLLVGVLVMAAPVLRAQETDPFRIALILWRGETEVEKGFHDYFTSQNIPVVFQTYNLDRNMDAMPGILETIRRDPPDLVYTWGTGITMATVGPHDAVDPARHITDIPVVFVMVSAPWQTGIAAPQGQTRSNVTGAAHIAPLSAQINAIRAYRPMDRLGVVFNADEANSVANIADLTALGQEMAFEVLPAPLGDGDAPANPIDIAGKVAELAKQGADFLYIGPDNFIGTHRDILTGAGFDHGLATFSATELEIRDGQAMFGLVSRYELVGRLAATKAVQILRDDVAPGDIPVETLERFSYLIRLSAAKRLKLYPPLPLLDYAEIIE
ncbi:MAG: ABC transporter substrate-binding protein [Pseudomonadota bacterium]